MEKQLITGNEPAMPTIESINHGGELVETRTEAAGLTKREYFASMAMQGICGCVLAADSDSRYTANGGWLHPETVATASVIIADALIAELKK